MFEDESKVVPLLARPPPSLPWVAKFDVIVDGAMMTVSANHSRIGY